MAVDGTPRRPAQHPGARTPEVIWRGRVQLPDDPEPDEDEPEDPPDEEPLSVEVELFSVEDEALVSPELELDADPLSLPRSLVDPLPLPLSPDDFLA